MSYVIDVDKLYMLRDSLVKSFVQREAEVTASLSGLISGEPVILVAPPGTAKTMLIERLSKLVNAKYFYYLLQRFTEPDELLGSLDINKLREGVYQRITKNRLPDAEIVFLDEIFKGSSAVRNLLLDIILNKRYLNGTEYKKLPMVAFYTASNEISTDAEDQAFYDRLTIRCFHGYVTEDSWLNLLHAGLDLMENHVETKPVMSVEDVKVFQNAVIQRAKSLKAHSTLLNKYIQALVSLKGKGIVLSDRRKIKVLVVTSAISMIYGEAQVSLDSLAEALRYTAIHDFDDAQRVEQVIIEERLSTFYEHVQKLQALTSELRNIASQVEKEKTLESVKALNVVRKKIAVELRGIPKNPRLLPYVRELKREFERATNIANRILSELGFNNE